MTDNALVVDDLTVTFGDLRAVDSASITLGTDTVACLVGPNGSGKTTLVRAAAGLLSYEGTVEYASKADRPVGYLPQAPSFRPQFTVRETLSFYADLVAADTDADAVADRVGLGGVTDRRVNALSGGMTRLLGIAQATVGEPPLVLLDEPSSGLDPMMTRHISTVLTDLAGGGQTVVVSTHDLRAVDRIADVVVVLDRGSVVAAGSPAALRDRTDTDDLEAAMAALVGGETGEVTTRESAEEVAK